MLSHGTTDVAVVCAGGGNIERYTEDILVDGGAMADTGLGDWETCRVKGDGARKISG